MPKGLGWALPARILQAAFLNAGDVQAEGTTELGQACTAPLVTVAGQLDITLSQWIRAHVLALHKAAIHLAS